MDGGPATLTALILVSAIVQIIISRWLFLFRRLFTPIVGGTVMMILSITLASVVFGLLDDASQSEPVAAPITALITLVVVAAFALRGPPNIRIWAPVVGIVAGCVAAASFGIYSFDRVLDAPWVGVPTEAPDIGLDFGTNFLVLLPSFLFLGIVIGIQGNGEAISQQRVAWRNNRAIDFKTVQGAISGTAAGNLIAAFIGAVPVAINPGIVSFTRITGMATRNVGYVIGLMFIVIAFLPKVSGLLSTIPGPVMTGYLILVTGLLFVEGATTALQGERDKGKLVIGGIAFWIGASFHFGLFTLPPLGAIGDALVKSAITTGGLAVLILVLYMEIAKSRPMRFQSVLHVDTLPDLNQFMTRFSDRRGWDSAMRDRLMAVAEETLLTLAPLDLSLDLDDDDGEEHEETRRLNVIVSADGDAAELEFIGGGEEGNLEDRIRQLQEYDQSAVSEQELSLQLLRSFASSVTHRQYSGMDVISVRVEQPSAAT